MIPPGQWAARFGLSARSDDADSRSVASGLDGEERLRGGRRIALVLIHGFAVDEEGAVRAYRELMRNLENGAGASGAGRRGWGLSSTCSSCTGPGTTPATRGSGRWHRCGWRARCRSRKAFPLGQAFVDRHAEAVG